MKPKDTKFASLDELNQDLSSRPAIRPFKIRRDPLRALPDPAIYTLPIRKILVNATHPGFVETKISVDDIHEPFPAASYGMSVLTAPL